MRQVIQKIRIAFFLLLALGTAQTAISQCGYDVELTANNLTIQGNIFNTLDYGPYVPQELEWYLPVTNEVFSTEASFEFTASAYGECAVCVDYKVTQQDGTECTEIICKNVIVIDPSLSCDASFDYQDYDGPMPVVGGVTFSNLSSGAYTEWSWDFGDGHYDSESLDGITHFYEESGSYEVKLVVWNGTPQDCYSEFSQTIDVFISDDPCDQLDCVWPGDTNGDGAATLEDMLNVGVGFGMTGPPREDISNTWEAKPAEDWAFDNFEGVNYKHFDCNGDGTISEDDIAAIAGNFVMLENGVSSTESNGVPISLSFDADTVTITQENQYLEINAGLNFGSSSIPMNEVYGVVLYLTYPQNYVVESSPVDFDFNENSFFGDMNTVLPLAKNVPEKGQTDIVLTRKNGSNINGFGRVSTLKFIIDSDIIDGRAENEGQTFAVGINVVAAIDVEGNEIDIALPEEPTGVFFKNGITTKVEELLDDKKIQVYPNPVSESFQIDLSEDLHPESFEVFNTLGKRVIFSELDFRQATVNVSRLPQGVYILKVQTEEGIGTKRIMVEKE